MKIMFFGDELPKYEEERVNKLRKFLSDVAWEDKDYYFYFGGYNRFEQLAAIRVWDRFGSRQNGRRILVASDRRQLWDPLLYNHRIEPAKRSLFWRHRKLCQRFMLQQVDVVCLYIDDPHGDAAKLEQKAKQLGKKVVRF